ncbi:MAG: hypothetical protein E4H14_04820 [Candidatus Thorarchaeota archaeon]|nr:MAG: hypothetical protein E4H14_04820 [Candidatus Thorarchaeota archaeon]
MNEESLHDLIDQNAILIGRSENAKGGAVIVLQNQGVIYVRNLSFWEDDVLGKQVSIKGIIRLEKYIPDPKVSEDGAISQGAIGFQYVLDDAQWHIK